MAIYTLRSGATAHPEDSVLQPFTDLIESAGVRDLSDTDHLKVVERAAGANMSVDISIGRGVIKGSGNAYPVRNTTALNSGTISNNTSGNPRIDAIVLYVDLAESPTTTADDVVKVGIVAGTPAASPVAPDDSAIQTGVGGSNPYLHLANVTVAHNETAINDADIEDVRQSFRVVGGSRRVTEITSSGSPVPNADTTDLFKITALAANASFGIPTGTPADGQALIIKIKDNGTARTLSWDSIYRAIGITLPTTTVISKLLYIAMVYNDDDTKWDVISVMQQN